MVFKITKSIGAISEPSKAGWVKELNEVSWNERDAKYDIRDWDPDHEKMSKGVTLTEAEAKKLMSVLIEHFSSEEEE